MITLNSLNQSEILKKFGVSPNEVPVIMKNDKVVAKGKVRESELKMEIEYELKN